MNWLIGLAASTVIVCAAMTAWLLRSVSNFAFTKTIDPGAIAGAIATLFSTAASLAIVWLVSYRYAHQASTKKAEADLLLEVVHDVKAALADLREAARPCHAGKRLTIPEQQRLLAVERELSNAVLSLDKAAALCPTSGHDLRSLKLARSELKDALTDSPFPGKMPPSGLNRITNAFRDFQDELINVTMKIVRH